MPYLALDTSDGLAVAVVADDLTVLSRTADPQPRRHAELLAVHMREALQQAAVRQQDLTAVIVGTGPAPFTGLRAGLVTARAFAYALGVPLWGVESAAGVAAQALDLLDGPTPPPGGHTVLVVTDAKRREVYTARYRRAEGKLKLVGTLEVGAAAVVQLTGAVAVGRAAAQVDAAADPALTLLDPDPAALVKVALDRLSQGEPLPVEPLYLRRPDAVPPAGNKRVLL